MTKVKHFVLAALAALLLAACGEPEPQFKLRDITGLMPELEFELTRAEDGETVTAADYRGGVTVVFFGFTNCPDICPTTLARFAAALDRLEPEAADDVRVLFVSVDPQRDTLERLRGYVNAFGPHFTGLRGPQSELREVTKRYRVTYGYGEPDASGYYDVSHSSAAFVFDRDNEIRLLVRGDDPIADIAHDLGVLAGG
ncbi:MAG: SCO family protein [Halofilum sp. (in: g-proteobacteria)]|nr:SCO family protein [Halofilum sp. (in: g-proteobacteria)]